MIENIKVTRTEMDCEINRRNWIVNSDAHCVPIQMMTALPKLLFWAQFLKRKIPNISTAFLFFKRMIFLKLMFQTIAILIFSRRQFRQSPGTAGSIFVCKIRKILSRWWNFGAISLSRLLTRAAFPGSCWCPKTSWRGLHKLIQWSLIN